MNSVRKLNVLQFLTLVFMIFLLFTHSRLFGFGLETLLLVTFMVYSFYPQFFGRIHGLSYAEIKHPILAVLVIMWTYSFYILSRIIGYMYEKDLGIYMYLISSIPVFILILYLTHYREWRNFYDSLTHMYLEDYMKKKAKERLKEIELELENRGISIKIDAQKEND